MKVIAVLFPPARPIYRYISVSLRFLQERLRKPIEFHSQKAEEKIPELGGTGAQDGIFDNYYDAEKNHAQESATVQDNAAPQPTESSEPKTPDRTTVQLTIPPPPTARKTPVKQPQSSPESVFSPQPKQTHPPLRRFSKEDISLDNFITPPKKRRRILSSYNEEDEEEQEVEDAESA